jgi:hypothetical protein
MRSEIKIVEDVAAPATVALVNIVTKEVAPDWNEWGHYILTGLGYVGALMGFGGGYVKNLGVASLSGTVDHIYNRVKGGVSSKVAGSRLAYRPASSPVHQPVSRSYQPEFEKVSPYAV